MPPRPAAPLLHLALALLLAGAGAASGTGCGVGAAVGGLGTERGHAPASGEAADGSGDTGDTGAVCLETDARAYAPCISDAQCDAGSACTTVPGFGGRYCAPPCDPAGGGAECDPGGDAGFDTVCTEGGRCARACGEPDSCPDALACQAVDDLDGARVCAGEPSGQAGFYGICTHPQAEGTDCPPDSLCFGGEFIGLDTGICLPTCPDGSCQAAPEDAAGVFGYCAADYLEAPVCVLVCIADASTCPTGQDCVTVGGSLGLCAPEGASVPEDLF